MTLSALVDAGVKEAVVPALSTLAQTILGAICILSLAVAILAVWKLLNVQEKAADRAEKHNARVEALVSKMTDAVTKFDKTLDRLVESERQSQEVQKEQMNLLLQLKNSFETTIRDALVLAGRYSRSYTPGGMKPPQSGE